MNRWTVWGLGVLAAGCGGDADVGTTESAPVEPEAPICEPGFADCNDDLTDECETSLLERTTCGGCDVACDVGQRCTEAGCADLTVTSSLQVGFPVTAGSMDADGFVYLAGRFSEPTDFGDGPETPVGVDLFVSRNTPEGRLDWVQTVPVPDGRREFPYDIELDGDDSVYVVGELEHAADFGDAVTRGDALDTESHAFVAKWTEAGEFRWADAFQYDASDTSIANAAAVRDEQLFTVGRTYGEHWYLSGYDAGTGVADAPLQFVQKSKPGRNVIPDGVAISPGGNVFVAGYWSGSADFGDGQREAKSLHGWISSYTAGGAFRWFREFEPPADAGAYAFDVTAPADDEIYVAVTDYASVDGAPIGTATVVRYDGLGSEQWSMRSVGSSGGWAVAQAVAAEPGAVYMLALLNGTVSFGDLVLESAPDSEAPGEPSTDLAVIAMDGGTGEVLWGVVVGNGSEDGTVGFDQNLVVHEGVVQFLLTTTGPLPLPGGAVIEPAGTPSVTAIRIE